MSKVTVGVLALQGGFHEHLNTLAKLKVADSSSSTCLTIVPQPVKTPEDLALCDALIIPGGESTTIALVARLSGLLDLLKQYEKPIWGTCAGAILLSRQVVGTKKGGQEVLAKMDVKVGRNGWGSQVESFEADLKVKGMKDESKPFKGVFIRAPVRIPIPASEDLKSPANSNTVSQVILSFLPTTPGQPPVEVVARLPDEITPSDESAPFSAVDALGICVPSTTGYLPTPPNEREEARPEDLRHLVALRQGNHLLTTFHPELTLDDRFHELFVREFVLPSLTQAKA
ncbi:hypothetical protein FRC04_001311 [Tulasnella sp. 424]|nr:hypothetical protein FRC04_001311 [Tulasnella sp. 424]KAG8966772.1 hypothetical protein FRC05_002408 [Tulasnella sp. 425]